MLSRIDDYSATLNSAHAVVLDTSAWLNCTIQAVNPSGTINITGTNDGGSGSNANTAQNFTAIQATNLATGATVTGVAGAGMFKIALGCKYIKIGGAGAAADSFILFFSHY